MAICTIEFIPDPGLIAAKGDVISEKGDETSLPLGEVKLLLARVLLSQ